MANGTPTVIQTDATATPEVTLEEALKKAEIAEQRRKETQAAYTKGQQELARLKAEKELEDTVIIDAATQEELETLKFEDPDAWKARLDKLSHEQNLKKTEILSKADMAGEIARREVLLDDFNTGRENPITFDTINKEIPPRITERLSNNEISFEDYLAEVDTYLSTPRVVAGSKSGGQEPDLNGAGGGSEVRASQSQQEQNYSDDVY